jgi:hypothetical protein
MIKINLIFFSINIFRLNIKLNKIYFADKAAQETAKQVFLKDIFLFKFYISMIVNALFVNHVS